MAEAGGKSKGGLMGLLIPLIAVTVVGGGGGAFLGMSLLAPKEPEKVKAAGDGVQSAGAEEQKGHGGAEEKGDGHGGAKADAHAEANAGPHGDAHGKPQGDQHGEAHGDAHGDAHGKSEGHGDAHAKAATKKEEAPPPDLRVKELPSLVTNLGGDKRSWVRLQSAIVYDAHETPHPESLIPPIMSDITAFMSTLDMDAIEGPDGLRRLQEELNERAATRSEKQVKEFILESLVVQ